MTIIFSSVTYALKAQRLLDFHHIRSAVSRSPSVTAVRGCGYGLRLAFGRDAEPALSLLASERIPVLGTAED